ncbi:hypothetical protein MSG28_003085 [Choristoneura fumiferana]|uniref:Uncharacterized protein n=1 Tax=Choristoneura fumiferana TaxID=7141 RepID=A0ACC0JKH7_CHOFU|nr:hypothetical protein MSG28_003085 [Choristoneura fumiferana]
MRAKKYRAAGAVAQLRARGHSSGLQRDFIQPCRPLAGNATVFCFNARSATRTRPTPSNTAARTAAPPAASATRALAEPEIERQDTNSPLQFVGDTVASQRLFLAPIERSSRVFDGSNVVVQAETESVVDRGAATLPRDSGQSSGTPGFPLRVVNGILIYEIRQAVLQVVGPYARSALIDTTILLANPAVKQQCLHCRVSAWRIRQPTINILTSIYATLNTCAKTCTSSWNILSRVDVASNQSMSVEQNSETQELSAGHAEAACKCLHYRERSRHACYAEDNSRPMIRWNEDKKKHAYTINFLIASSCPLVINHLGVSGTSANEARIKMETMPIDKAYTRHVGEKYANAQSDASPIPSGSLAQAARNTKKAINKLQGAEHTFYHFGSVSHASFSLAENDVRNLNIIVEDLSIDIPHEKSKTSSGTNETLSRRNQKICKRKATTPCHNHVKSILYKNNVLTNDMAYGQYNESVARTLFIEKLQKAVRPAGLFIDEEFGFLGASPDDPGPTAASRAAIKPIYVPLLGTGLLSEQEGLGYSSHAGPVRIGNFTRTIELLRRTNVSMIQELKIKKPLSSIVQGHILSFFGHVARRDDRSVERLVVQGKVEGTRARGRSPMRWTDQIKAALGSSLHKYTRKATVREEWRRMVVGPQGQQARSARTATTILLANPAVKQQCLHCCVSAWRTSCDKITDIQGTTDLELRHKWVAIFVREVLIPALGRFLCKGASSGNAASVLGTFVPGGKRAGGSPDGWTPATPEESQVRCRPLSQINKQMFAAAQKCSSSKRKWALSNTNRENSANKKAPATHFARQSTEGFTTSADKTGIQPHRKLRRSSTR